MTGTKYKRIGIIGGGPAALFVFKHLIKLENVNLEISFFEKKDRFGSGMPYSDEGSGAEHVTNISGNEIPGLVTSMKDWLNKAPGSLMKEFKITAHDFNEYKVVPRLFLGEYLMAQFETFKAQAKLQRIKTHFLTNTKIVDVIHETPAAEVQVKDEQGRSWLFDDVIMCMGHVWPTMMEGKVAGWYDSPYPPAKLELPVNHPVAIKGASLTAIDAIRTLARANGQFLREPNGYILYKLNDQSEGFRLVMHSLQGLLPAIRFHLAEPQLKMDTLQEEELKMLMSSNEGFVPLDYIFNKRFKEPMEEANPELFKIIKDMQVEEFVEHILAMRERIHPFDLFKAEFTEAGKSIKRKQPVYWKELLAELSYALNYPAKHLSAEDMLRLKKTLMPLISIIIAFVPQDSCRELLALYDAGYLELVEVDRESEVYPSEDGSRIIYQFKNEHGQKQETFYQMFIDATGQKPVAYSDFPFESLKNSGTISEAYLKFRDAEQGKIHWEKDKKAVLLHAPNYYYLRVPGININDDFQVLDGFNACDPSLYIMAVPYIAGLNPDFSGLDFCETAGKRIASSMQQRYDNCR